VSTSDLSLSVGAASRHCSPNLGESQYAKPFSRSASRVGVTTWVPTHAPILWVIRPRGSLTSSRTMHVDRLLERDPLMGRLCPEAFQRWRVLPRPHTSCTDPSWVGSLPAETGGVTWKPPVSSIITVWGTEARGLHAPTMSPSTVLPTPRSFLPVGVGGWHHSGTSTFLVWTRSTPEAGQLPCLLHSAPDGSHYVDFGQRPRTGRYNFDILVWNWLNKFMIIFE